MWRVALRHHSVKGRRSGHAARARSGGLLHAGQADARRSENQGEPAHRTYYFASEAHRQLFNANPAKYEPQHGGFCSNGTPFKIKLGSDPTEWEIYEGRLFIFGDIIGHSFWSLDPRFNVSNADKVWDDIKDVGWRSATFSAWISPVPWYRSHRSLTDEWNAKHPDKPITFDPGGLIQNLVMKYPGWRAREGFGQPALGLVGTDPCPPACVGTVPQGYSPPWAR